MEHMEHVDTEHMEHVGEEPPTRRRFVVAAGAGAIAVAGLMLGAAHLVGSRGTDEEEDDAGALAVDSDRLTIAFTDHEVGETEIKVGVTIENLDADTTYLVATDEGCNIDGVQVVPGFSKEVPAGETVESTIKIAGIEELVAEGVQVTDIFLSFYAYDNEDSKSELVIDGEGDHIYPDGEDAVQMFEREGKDTDIVLVDTGEIAVTVISCAATSSGYGIGLCIENGTEGALALSASDARIGGVSCEPWWSAATSAGLSSFETISWTLSQLEEAGITDPEAEIERIEFTLDVVDADSGEALIDGLAVTLEP